MLTKRLIKMLMGIINVFLHGKPDLLHKDEKIYITCLL